VNLLDKPVVTEECKGEIQNKRKSDYIKAIIELCASLEQITN
jgi:hypothetical protein